MILRPSFVMSCLMAASLVVGHWHDAERWQVALLGISAALSPGARRYPATTPKPPVPPQSGAP